VIGHKMGILQFCGDFIHPTVYSVSTKAVGQRRKREYERLTLRTNARQSIQAWPNLFQRALYPHNTQGIRPFRGTRTCVASPIARCTFASVVRMFPTRALPLPLPAPAPGIRQFGQDGFLAAFSSFVSRWRIRSLPNRANGQKRAGVFCFTLRGVRGATEGWKTCPPAVKFASLVQIWPACPIWPDLANLPTLSRTFEWGVAGSRFREHLGIKSGIRSFRVRGNCGAVGGKAQAVRQGQLYDRQSTIGTS